MPEQNNPRDNPNDHIMDSIEGLWDTANAIMQADLKKRVNKTQKKPDDTALPGDAPPSTDEAISRLKDMNQLRPPTATPDPPPPIAPEAMFSDAFTRLVQQTIEDYLDKNLAPIVSKAVQAELQKKTKTHRKT